VCAFKRSERRRAVQPGNAAEAPRAVGGFAPVEARSKQAKHKVMKTLGRAQAFPARILPDRVNRHDHANLEDKRRLTL
jgi:hypothetical protein